MEANKPIDRVKHRLLREFRAEYPKFESLIRFFDKAPLTMFVAKPRNGYSGLVLLVNKIDVSIVSLTDYELKYLDQFTESGYKAEPARTYNEFREKLHDYFDEQINEQHIEQVVCRCLGIDVDVMHTKTQKQPVVRARQLSCYLAQQATGRTDSSLAYYFWDHHANAINGRRVIKDLYFTDFEFKEKVDEILEELSLSKKIMEM